MRDPEPSRGVYRSRFRSDGGNTILLALDRCGQIVGQVVVRDPGSVQEVAGHLWAILDAVDPGLRLIRFSSRDAE